MNLEQCQTLALDIKHQYREANRSRGAATWDATAYANGLLVDVAGLIKMLMIKDGFREGEQNPERLAHELSDIVWSAFAIADELEIDLARELPEQFAALRARFSHTSGDYSDSLVAKPEMASE